MTMKYFNYKTDIGYITIAEEDGKITELSFGKETRPEGSEEETALIKEAIIQIRDYLKGKRRSFELPVKLSGTEFQLKVWDALQKIPYGETRSYKGIAEMAGNPKAYRAVGNANNRNPVALIIP